MQERQRPPTRCSPSLDGMVNPRGQSHSRMCSGSVHIRYTSSAGASKMRVRTSSRSRASAPTSFLLACMSLLLLALQLLQVIVQTVEALLPVAAVVLDPIGHLAQRAGLEPAGAPLGLAAAADEPGLL